MIIIIYYYYINKKIIWEKVIKFKSDFRSVRSLIGHIYVNKKEPLKEYYNCFFDLGMYKKYKT